MSKVCQGCGKDTSAGCLKPSCPMIASAAPFATVAQWFLAARDTWRKPRELPRDPGEEAYWSDPANQQWARYSSVYDDRSGGC
jgi:hypothetical protein